MMLLPQLLCAKHVNPAKNNRKIFSLYLRSIFYCHIQGNIIRHDDHIKNNVSVFILEFFIKLFNIIFIRISFTIYVFSIENSIYTGISYGLSNPSGLIITPG
ncbi:hypothetical protein D3C78_1444730 [compost metagenome]